MTESPVNIAWTLLRGAAFGLVRVPRFALVILAASILLAAPSVARAASTVTTGDSVINGTYYGWPEGSIILGGRVNSIDCAAPYDQLGLGFDYALDDSYTAGGGAYDQFEFAYSVTAPQGVSAGAGLGPEPALSIGALYHFRIVAWCSEGYTTSPQGQGPVVYGADRTFVCCETGPTGEGGWPPPTPPPGGGGGGSGGSPATPAGPPVIRVTCALGVGVGEAVIVTRLDPNGAPAVYRVVYRSGFGGTVLVDPQGPTSATGEQWIATQITHNVFGTIRYDVEAKSSAGIGRASASFSTPLPGYPGFKKPVTTCLPTGTPASVITGPAVDPESGKGTHGDPYELNDQVQAKITGTVSPNGQPTVFRFQYHSLAGFTDNTYASTDWQFSAQARDLRLSAVLSVLDPGTIYQYRVVAQSPAGSVEGPWRYFKTAGLINTTKFIFSSTVQVLVDGSTVKINVTAPDSWLSGCSGPHGYDFSRARCGSSSAAKRLVLAKVVRRGAAAGPLTLKIKPNRTARKLVKRMLKKRRHGTLRGVILETIVTPPRDAPVRGGYRQKQKLKIRF
jgi:hypothetical protein